MNEWHHWVGLAINVVGLISVGAGLIVKIVKTNAEHAIQEALQEKRISDLEKNIDKGSGTFGDHGEILQEIRQNLVQLNQRVKHLEDKVERNGKRG